MTDTFTVRDGGRIIAFDGVLLAESSSKRPEAPRWTELQLYRTESGTYVISRIGRSIVVHVPSCEKVFTDLPKFTEDHADEDPFEVAFPHSCVDNTTDLRDLVIERTRFEGLIAETPAGVIEALTTHGRGVRSLTRIATELLEDASQKDDAIADVFYVSYVS